MNTKKQIILDLVSRKEGASMEKLIQATGWQKHTLHGALSTLRKNLPEGKTLNLEGTSIKNRHYCLRNESDVVTPANGKAFPQEKTAPKPITPTPESESKPASKPPKKEAMPTQASA